MADSNASPWVELLKYPVTILTIVAALALARSCVGISFGDVEQIGPDGIKFTNQTKQEITELSSRLNTAIAAIDELKKGEKTAVPALVAASIAAASETVPDQTAQFASVTSAARNAAKVRGFIWVGDKVEGQWSRVKLAESDADKPLAALDKLVPNTAYKVLGNMVLRENLPSNDADYFRARKSLGTLPRDSKVRLLSAPVAVDRKFAVQYWVEVEPQ